MSVINKMLQDLEQRQQPDLAVSEQKQAPRQGSGRTRYYFGFALLAGLMLIGVLLFSFSRPHQQSSGAQVQQTATIDQGASGDQLQPLANISQPTEMDEAGLAGNMAVLTAEQIKTEPVTAVTAEKKAKPLDVADAAVVVAATLVGERQAEVLTMQRELTPVLAQPVRVNTSLVKTGAAAEPAAAAQPQTMINKQQLSAAQQQQNMQHRANASEAAGDTSGAITIWQQIVSQQPAEANGYLNLARLWLKQQQIITASQVLLQARQKGVLSAEINMQLAQLAVRQGQWQQALAFLPDQFELAAEPEYFGMKATVLQQLQQHAAALGWYQRLQQLQPDQGRWSLGAALASEQLGQSAQAHQYYQHAWQYRQALSVSSHNFIQQRLKATEP
ncbi:MAG: hypothetical protein CML20_22765 [Rheinheimera sp.]|uniref:hypothetical protein n=1 Tax=Arsukibacterium sp. UBA3155 TaxID=1946058 RepID=UPI000C947824|nr:hypothetical protein [Arsukibacterium sp. UBA3155]MAD77554.1 hypothetical protein [Rheinheimera sp.]|tara:strand:- start:49537 stop:50700 length:1164 start_codon:yes stop_codon:yes gene_type:complete